MTLPRAVFFDRDGVVNLSPGEGYVLSVDQFIFVPGIVQILAWCRARGLRTVLVTSQQGVGKGLMTQQDLELIHGHMQRTLTRHDAAFDSIHACTGLEGQCDCRKPSPKMIFDAVQALGGLNLEGSALVGDNDRDIQMARKAGLGFAIRLQTDKPAKDMGDLYAQTMAEVFAGLKTWFSL